VTAASSHKCSLGCARLHLDKSNRDCIVEKVLGMLASPGLLEIDWVLHLGARATTSVAVSGTAIAAGKRRSLGRVPNLRPFLAPAEFQTLDPSSAEFQTSRSPNP
jgi:hypothetical protein